MSILAGYFNGVVVVLKGALNFYHTKSSIVNGDDTIGWCSQVRKLFTKEHSTFLNGRATCKHILLNGIRIMITTLLYCCCMGNAIISKKWFHQGRGYSYLNVSLHTLPKLLNATHHCLVFDHSGLFHWLILILCINCTSSALVSRHELGHVQ